MHCTKCLELGSYRSRPAGVTWGYTPCSRERNGNNRISSARTELMTSFGSWPVAMFSDSYPAMATISSILHSGLWIWITMNEVGSLYTGTCNLAIKIPIIRQEIISVGCYRLHIRIPLGSDEGSCRTLINAITLKGQK